MVAFEAYGTLANLNGTVAGYTFVNGQMNLPDDEAPAAERILCRFHAVRVIPNSSYQGDRRDPQRPGRRSTDRPSTPEPVEEPVPPAPEPEPEPEPEPDEEPETVAAEPPVIMRPLEEEVLALERPKLKVLIAGCDQGFIDRLQTYEQAHLNRRAILRLLDVPR